MKDYKGLQIQNCECHPHPVYLGVFHVRKIDYTDAIKLPVIGKMCFVLAGKLDGCHDHGWYVQAFGRIFAFTPIRGRAH